MKVIGIPTDQIVVNQEIAARVGDPDPEKVQRFAENFIARVTEGSEHQLQPGIVRETKGKKGEEQKYELIAGRHRFEAVIQANELGVLDEPLLFMAYAVPHGDEAALIDAIQENEFRVDSSPFDTAAAIERLVAMGKKQSDIAAIFGRNEGNISQLRKIVILGGNYRKALENGDIEIDTAVLLVGMDDDEVTRAEIFDVAIRNKQRMAELEARYDNKRKKKEADNTIDAAKIHEKELADQAKAAEKARKEKEAEMAKTKDVEALQVLRNKTVELKKTEDAVKKEHTKAVAAKEKAVKAKEKLKEATAVKKKVTPEDLKKAAKSKGKKIGRDDAPKQLTMKEFYIGLESLEGIAKELGKPLSNSVKGLLGKIMEYADQDLDEKGFIIALTKLAKQ